MILEIQCTQVLSGEENMKPSLASYMRPQRVVMKFDKLLSVIVRRCEKHVYYKLTNKRPTDTLFIDKQETN